MQESPAATQIANQSPRTTQSTDQQEGLKYDQGGMCCKQLQDTLKVVKQRILCHAALCDLYMNMCELVVWDAYCSATKKILPYYDRLNNIQKCLTNQTAEGGTDLAGLRVGLNGHWTQSRIDIIVHARFREASNPVPPSPSDMMVSRGNQ